MYDGPNHQLCWHIAQGCLWVSSGFGAGRIPLDELILFGPLDEKAKALSEERYPRHKPGTTSVTSSYAWHLGPLADIQEAWRKQERYRRFGPYGTYDHFEGPGPVRDTYADFVPDTKDAGRLFVLSRDKYYGSFDVWAGKGTWSKENEMWELDWSEKPIEQVKSYFHDPFVMYRKGTTYLFMTPSGRYYLSEDPVERDKLLDHPWVASRNLDKGKRNAHPHWGSIGTTGTEGYLASAVIVDADADETYVFLRPAKDTKGDSRLRYFALSLQPKVETYYATELHPVALDEPLKTLVQYTQLLIDKGKIRIK
jgi:hypothetical protein